MSFASFEFLIFFLVVLTVVSLLQQSKNTVYKEVFLLIASYFFYGYWDWRFCALLLFVTLCAYITALFIHERIVYVLGVTVPLVVLVFLSISTFSLTVFPR